MKNDKGFSLLEVLVAVTILGIALGTLMALFSGSLNSAGASEEYSRAVLLARKGIEDAMLAETIVPGTDGGDFAGGVYAWTTTITPEELSDEEMDGEKYPPFRLYEVEVEVRWRSGTKMKSAVLRSGVLKDESPKE
jgi:general secretion pathway protein I